MGRKEGDTDPYQPDAPGWYPDPWSATGGGERYFDGKRWGTNERPRARHSTNVITMKPPRARGVKALVARFRIPIILLLIAAVAVGLWVRQESQRDAALGGGSVDRSIGVTRPPPGAEEAPTRLAPKVAPVSGPGKYEFQRTQPEQEQTPVAFDPCRPIHWVYNPAGGPPDGEAIVQDSFSALAAATGLQFVYDGPTAELPTRDRRSYLPDRYDRNRWAPVLVAWSDEKAFRDLIGHVTGATRPDIVTQPDGPIGLRERCRRARRRRPVRSRPRRPHRGVGDRTSRARPPGGTRPHHRSHAADVQRDAARHQRLRHRATCRAWRSKDRRPASPTCDQSSSAAYTSVQKSWMTAGSGNAPAKASVVSMMPTTPWFGSFAHDAPDVRRPSRRCRRWARARCGAPARRRRSPTPANRRESVPARRRARRSGRWSWRRWPRARAGERRPGADHAPAACGRTRRGRRPSTPGRRRPTGTRVASTTGRREDRRRPARRSPGSVPYQDAEPRRRRSPRRRCRPCPSGSNTRSRSTTSSGWPAARAMSTPSTSAPLLYSHRSPGW